MAGSPRTQRGSASAELAILVPMFVMLALVMAAGGRLYWAHGQVEQAAAAAARAATIYNSADLAKSAAQRVAHDDLASVGLHCRNMSLAIDTSGFALHPGQVSEVRVDVSCELDMSDLLVPGLPGSFNLQASAVERIDTYRSRRP